ncbi:MAG: hypothetical protein F4Y49_03465 [Dehalococcoidia bacterium]|nr:hypothetical protein [Dehalococcoidia bacterium]
MKITLNIDEDIVKKVRKIAIEKDTTLTAMVRDYLTWVANGDAAERERRVLQLEDSFKRLSRNMGPRDWARGDLYERWDIHRLYAMSPYPRLNGSLHEQDEVRSPAANDGPMVR